MNNVLRTSLALALLSLSLSGCAGKTLDGGSTEEARSSVVGDGATTNTAGHYTEAQVAAAKAACSAPHGPADPATPATLPEKLVGPWYLCSAPNAFYLTKSLELTADGQIFVLVGDGAGGLERAEGLDNQASWSLDDDSGTWITPGPMLPEFETAPRRMRITVATSGYENWFVPIQ